MTEQDYVEASTPEEQVAMVITSLAPYWPLFVLRGVIMLIFGLVFVAFPGTTIVVLGSIFGAFLILDAIAAFAKTVIVYRYMPEEKAVAGVYFTVFLLSMAVGISSVVYPELTGKVLLTMVAVWLLLIGLLELLMACIFRFEKTSACLMGVGGLLYIVTAIIFLSDLDRGIVVFTKLLGFIIMVFGAQICCVGMRLRSVKNGTGEEGAAFNNPDAAVV